MFAEKFVSGISIRSWSGHEIFFIAGILRHKVRFTYRLAAFRYGFLEFFFGVDSLGLYGLQQRLGCCVVYIPAAAALE